MSFSSRTINTWPLATLLLAQRLVSRWLATQLILIPLRLGLFFILVISGCDDQGGATESPPSFDLIIQGGIVYDGLGNPPSLDDIGVREGIIVSVGDLSGATSTVLIDAAGNVVAPGFIDIHSHATSSTLAGSALVRRPLAENYIRQGVTTVIGGQDGSSALNIGEFLSGLDTIGTAINAGLFIGHGSIRVHVLGENDVDPSEDELAQMTGLVSAAMRDGAFGLSSGLEYIPANFAENSELIALAKPAAEAGGLYISHIRDEGADLLESVAEVIEVAEKAGIAAQVTHHKVIGKSRWGGSTESLGLIDEARERGLDVSSDVYPYTASSTGLTLLFPAWSKEGGNTSLLGRLANSETRKTIHADIVAHINAERGGDPYTIVAARCPDFPEADGFSLGALLENRNQNVTVENAAFVVIELVEKGGCLGVFHSMSEEDVRRIMTHEQTMISSDGGVPGLGEGVPHPRNYGAFARVLARYVREWGVLSLEEAIYKMSGLPAARLNLANRGTLVEGNIADIVIFDADTVQDHAEFGDPHHYATGIIDVFVYGIQVLKNGEPTGELPGRALRHKRPS